ncbi:helix-turn-helix domain-containing protein [Streptomyces sp. 8N706]|uniref:helix-turn-helix domain-containing protein n=1 Tax=Streptomyces sp. 8N706 TaxID=3457416 RepID=UPI003FD159FE
MTTAGPPSSTHTSAQNPPRTLAGKLNRLFDTCHPADRGPWRDSEVARALTEAARRAGDSAAEISETALGRLRNGQQENPSERQLRALADFFGVPAAYFFEDSTTAKVSEDLALLSALRHVGAREVALRATGAVNEEALSALVPVFRHLGEADRNGRMEPLTRPVPDRERRP